MDAKNKATCTEQPICSPDQCVKAAGEQCPQFNGCDKATCAEQPICRPDQHLKGDASTTRGTCTVTDGELRGLEADEDGKFKVFLCIAGPAALVAQVVSCRVARARWGKGGVCELPFRAHWWVTTGATGKLVDLMTDFGSFFINYGMIGDTSNRFYKLYEIDGGNSADTVRTIALVSLILGTLCFIPDVHYGLVLKSGGGGLAGAKFWSAMSFLFEDAPQIAVSLVFAFAIRITELSWDDETELETLIMFVVSLALSAITVLDRLFIIFCKCGSGDAPFAI